jgi:hypothetical protein
MGEIVHTHKYQRASNGELADQLTKEKIAAVKANRLKAELEIAERKRLLIPKQMVLQQAAVLFLALRNRRQHPHPWPGEPDQHHA